MYELVVSGSHGMAAHAYPAVMDMAAAGIPRPDLPITRTVGLDNAGFHSICFCVLSALRFRRAGVPPSGPRRARSAAFRVGR